MTLRLHERLWREPLLHFLLLGGLLFAVRGLVPADPAADKPLLQVSAEQQARLVRVWRRQTGAAPSAQQMQTLIKRHVDEELLLREALRLQLDRRDRVVLERLVKNLQFAGGYSYGHPDNPEAFQRQVEAARALDMVQHDLVVRRRLVQIMRNRIHSEVRVSEAQLRQWYMDNREQFVRPARYRVSQLFFNNNRHGPAAEAVALDALKRLRGGLAAEKVDADPLLGDGYLASATRDQIRQRLGQRAADAIATASPQKWIGPVASIYGVHLFRVDAVTPGQPLPYAQARTRAAAIVYAQQEARAEQLVLGAMRKRYRIQVQPAELQLVAASDPQASENVATGIGNE